MIAPSRPDRLVLLALPTCVLFPGAVATVEIVRPENLRALRTLVHSSERCVVVPLLEQGGRLAPDTVRSVGTLARVVNRIRLPSGHVRVVLEGLERRSVGAVALEEGFLVGSVAPLEHEGELDGDTRGGLELMLAHLRRIAESDARYPELAGLIESNGGDPARIADLAASLLPFSYAERARLLAETSTAPRVALLNRLLARELVRARVGHDIEDRVAERIKKTFLREKLAALRDELGEPEPHAAEAAELETRVRTAGLPPGAEREALRELSHFRHLAPTSPEAARVRNWLAWLLELPWNTLPSAEQHDPERLARVALLFEERYVGLADVKERIAEVLAVRALGGRARANTICFVGPPGTGKSSLAHTIAEALERPFVGVSVGGTTHERELVGTSHRADAGTPGAILSGLARAGAQDPVVLLDKIDELAAGEGGGSAGALVALLDPEQNGAFLDRYLGVPFDLSRCLFVATASDAQKIPGALLDRMELIEFPGYTEAEKLQIASQFLLPRARAEAGLVDQHLRVSRGALHALVRSYTEEAGVRQLERHVAALARKAAVEVVKGKRGLAVQKRHLVSLLGPRTKEEDLRLQRPAIGVAMGLAWTAAGGSLLPIEALAMHGTGQMTLTGQVGDVLRESVQTALSFVRSCCASLGVQRGVFDSLDLHLHFPSGSTPKDGPSAGIAIATAIMSLLTERASRHDVAMSGEVSLLGAVLPVGGLREKLLAAIRAGIPEVVAPARNAQDILRLAPDIKSRIRIHLIDDVREAFQIALVAKPAGPTARRRTPHGPRRTSGGMGA